MRERSARASFRCIGRRRSLPRLRRRFEGCSSFVHCELAGCDVQTRLVSRSCGSFRPTRPAHRRPRHRTCHDGPPLRLPYASTSASPAFADLLLFLNDASLAARRGTQRAIGPGQQAGVVPVVATAGGTSSGSGTPVLRQPREGIPRRCRPWPSYGRARPPSKTRRGRPGPPARRPGRVPPRHRRVPRPPRRRPAGPPQRLATRSHRRTRQPPRRARTHPSPAAPPHVATGTCQNVNTECCRLMCKHRGR